MQSIDTRLQSPEIEQEEQPTTPPEPDTTQEPVLSPNPSRNGATLTSRTTASGVEGRTADKREIEKLKATIRTLEKKVMESRDLRRTMETLTEEKGKYDRIVETMKVKIKNLVSDLSELKAKYEDAERRAAEGDSGKSGELESEIELANLDKEMAEERAELYHAELESLKLKHEELELESEILREENRELGSVMSPEERASAGWVQMEKEVERYRQALMMLKDMSQETEASLRGDIKELQDNLDELEGTATQNTALSEKLTRIEETNKHLMSQLEAAEANDDVVIAMEAQKEQSASTIEQLRKQLQEFEEHIQVADELETFHLEEEKRLHYALDETEAQFNEQVRRGVEQEKVIEDLEYTLTKFRDVVSGLQSDIDELRRSRDISEQEAHEMSSKSRAMMDLNLQLQNSAGKTQLKTIDYEMGRMNAEQAQAHLDIMQLFVAEGFERERNPVLALLCFKRIASKASLVKSLLSERMKDRAHLADSPFEVYEVIEKIGQIVVLSERSTQFMSSCSPDEFARYSGALLELEPVERCCTLWVESLKRDELGADGSEALKRMIGILADINEKLITETGEAKATELVCQAKMVEAYADSAAIQLSTLIKLVQSRLGSASEEDEESLEFDKRMDSFATKARTVKYLAGKVGQLLIDLRSGSMCLGETAWSFFEEAESAASIIANLTRDIGTVVVGELNKLEHEEPFTYASIFTLIGHIAKRTPNLNLDARASDDAYTILATLLTSLQSKVDDLQSKSSDLSSATEFEKHPAPWTLRAKELKQRKVQDLDTANELARTQVKNTELGRLLSEREKVVEELNVKVELLERRTREASTNAKDLKALQSQLEAAHAEIAAAKKSVEEVRAELEAMTKTRDAEKAELENLRAAALSGADAAAVVVGGENSETAKMLRVDVECLKAEITSLQSAVRYLRQENEGLRIPVGELALRSAQNAWLHPSTLGGKRSSAAATGKARVKVRQETTDVLDSLLSLAAEARPVRFALHKRGSAADTDASIGEKKTVERSRYTLARQREALARWEGWKSEVVKRARVESRTARTSALSAGLTSKMRGVAGKSAGGKQNGSATKPMKMAKVDVFDNPALVTDKGFTGAVEDGGVGAGVGKLRGGRRVRIVENSP
jgi:dynactin 1